MANKLSPLEGLDFYVGPQVYKNLNLELYLFTNTLGALTDSSVFADLVLPTGSGANPFLFDTSAKLEGWEFSQGVVTYNPQIRRASLLNNELTGATVLETTFDWSSLPAAEQPSANDPVEVVLDNGSKHSTTLASFSTSTLTVNDGLPSAAAAGNAVKVTRVGKVDHRIAFTNTGASDWSAPITGAALVYNGGTQKHLLHVRENPDDLPFIMGPNAIYYVNLRDSI